MMILIVIIFIGLLVIFIFNKWLSASVSELINFGTKTLEDTRVKFRCPDCGNVQNKFYKLTKSSHFEHSNKDGGKDHRFNDNIESVSHIFFVKCEVCGKKYQHKQFLDGATIEGKALAVNIAAMEYNQSRDDLHKIFKKDAIKHSLDGSKILVEHLNNVEETEIIKEYIKILKKKTDDELWVFNNKFHRRKNKNGFEHLVEKALNNKDIKSRISDDD